MRLFWHKGYEAASLAEILTATGLSKSSLYAAFGNKDELFLSAFDAYRDDRQRDMQRVLGTGTGREAIEAFFRMIVADLRDPIDASGCMSINQAVELAPHNPQVRDRVEEDLQRIENALTVAIERGHADGSIASERHPRDLARLLVLGFPGLQIMVRAGLAADRAERSLGQLLSLLD